MSEGISAQNDRQSKSSTSDNRQEEESRATSLQAAVSVTPLQLAHPRAGALVVEAYVAGTGAQNRIAPKKILFECVRFLIDCIRENTGKNTSKEAFALLEATELACQLRVPTGWDPSFLDSVVASLQSHSALAKSSSLQPTIEKLLSYQVKVTPSTMNSSDDPMASLMSGIADQFSLAADSSSGISRILAELGPSSTRSTTTFREVLADIARTNGPLTEASLANLIFFFSDKRDEVDNNVSGLSSVLLGSIISGRGNEPSAGGWNLDSVAQVLDEDYGSRDWSLVATSWDFPSFKMKDTQQFRALIELYRAGAKTTPPVSAFTSHWQNTAGQLSVLETMMAVPPNVFVIPLDEEETADFATALAQAQASAPNPRCLASTEILQRLLHLSDLPSLYRRVRDLFVRCLLTCPEVLLCSLVRLQLRVSAQRETPGESTQNAGMNIKTELMRELIPLFFRPNAHHRVQNLPAAIRRLHSISPTTVMAACYEAWRSTMQESPAARLAVIMHIINIVRLLPSPAEAVATLLSGNKEPEYSIAVAFVMADNEFLQLKPWLGEKLSTGNSANAFAVSLVSYLRQTYSSSTPRASGGDGQVTPLVSLENIAVSLQLLRSLDPSILAQQLQAMPGSTLREAVLALMDACLTTHPSLRASLSVQSSAPVPAPAPTASSDDVEEMATKYFKKIYTSEQSISEVVEMLKRFKNSGNTKENEIFACMVHNLFDEYRFFAKYPEQELRITGILFGALIQEQLVSSITLGIALRYVLEALRKPPTSHGGKMFKFGMFSLEQFKGRLHEWPQYCSHIVQIPHLRDSYADLVAEIEHEMTRSQNRVSTEGAPRVPQGTAVGERGRPESFAAPSSSTNEGVTDRTPVSPRQLDLSAASEPVRPRVAEFGVGLGRAVTEGADEEGEFDAPPDTVLDRVQFLVNNLAPSNVEQKAAELKAMLEPTYFGWLGQFLVVKRISTQANFHSLYLSFLDNLGDYGKGLVEAILSSVYHNIGKLLRSPKITTSSSERSYLKNLGIWLGQITLSRNRPILQIMLDCKELLLQGYETGKLIAVAPFLAKTLEGAKNSVIFRPPNPWLMGLLGVFRSVYDVEGLKMNIKFEVEVLCKNLGIKLEDIPLRGKILAGRVAPVKERNPDFNTKSSTTQKAATSSRSDNASVSSDGGASGRTTPVGIDQQDTVIPNLKDYVTVNPTLQQILQPQGSTAVAGLTPATLNRLVPLAVDKAIREIIQPVVERSVTIACITSREIVSKDFAMESDENRMRRAGQLMVANLAGSLALVTCREPLRSSISTHLRQLLTSSLGRADSLGEQEQNVIEQCVQVCAAENLELGCRLIEKAATEKAVKDVDDALAPAMNARRTHREQTGQPFYDMSIFSNANQRYPAALPDQLRPRPGGLRSEHFQLYESFQRMARASPGLPSGESSAGAAPRNAPASGTPSADEDGTISARLGSIASRIDSAVSSLLSTAAQSNRSADVKLSMLPPDHQIRQLLAAVKQVMPNASSTGGVSRPMSTQEQDLVLGFSQGVFKRLYELSLSEPLRLEALVAVLESINVFCPKLGHDMGTWATYAPTNTEAQRRLHKTVLLLLVRSRLLSVHDLDTFLAARTDNGANPLWVEFSLLFVRTAFMEQISTAVDFPKLMELFTRIADGRSRATAQILQAYRAPILRILEEARPSARPRDVPNHPHLLSPAVQQRAISEGSSLSTESLTTMATATRKVMEANDAFAKNDPANARQQIVALLDAWIRVQSDSTGNEKAVAQYLQALQQFGVGKVEEKTERFFRLATLVVVESVKPSATSADGSVSLNYTFVDMYSKLLQLLFRHMNTGGSQDQVDAQRLGVLNKILGVIVRAMMWHCEKTKSESSTGGWDQRPWFRLMLNLLLDLNKPEPAFDSIKLGMLSVFGAALHTCQPLVMPGFAFAWLELVSHRHFLPNLMLFPGEKAWHIAHQLVVDLLLFLEPSLRRVELSPAIKKLYEGTLRVLMVVVHDFPSFLASYHLSLCNVIPENCVQLRNIVLSATPKSMSPPDPFTPNLKIDLLAEIGQSPPLHSNVLGPIEGISGHIDAYLKDTQRRSLSGLLQLLYTEGTTDVNAAKANSLIVYIGAHALARLQSSQISLSRTPEIEIMLKLMEYDDRGRYICLNAIANQLRFPSSHTHYFSCVMLYIFSETKSVAVKEQVTRVLLERLIVNRPHPWGLLITFIELIKNSRYGFWNYPFTRCATEIEKVFESVARSCMPPGGHQRTALVGGDDQ